MRRTGRLTSILCVALFASVAVAASALAHPAQYHYGALAGPPKANLEPDLSAARMLQGGGGQLFPTDQGAVDRAAASPGPCTSAARDSMPDGAPHDHQAIAQHRFGCRVKQSEFLPLKEELTKAFGREDVVLGEMDVKADIAAVAVTFPRSGVVFFDVKDPAKPKILSIYRGGECDSQPIDINCGAFIDLSADGKVAYLSVQNLSSIPDPSLTTGRPGTSGVEVLSLADPKNPQLVQIYTVTAGVTGTHTSRSHVIPPAPASGGNGPRAPGEYLFSNQNAVGVNIAKVERLPGGVPQVRFVNLIDAPALHDTFIQNDPTTGRTYLYLADGFGDDLDGTEGTAFVVYDVTDPQQPKRLAQWDLTPECETDWYSHTIDVTTVNGRRYVTLPSELFVLGNQSQADTDAGCGRKRDSECGTLAMPCQRSALGNGNMPGPLWIVDATDFSKLAQARDSEAEIKRKSQEALVATWENPAGRAAGNMTFSPHNQQIVGDRIYLSHYHGGVYELDASKAFDGDKQAPETERPRELGFVVPSGEPTRKSVELATNPLLPFFAEFPFGHPEIWDAVHYRGCTLAADMTGGFYSYEFEGDKCTPESGGPLGAPAPVEIPTSGRNVLTISTLRRKVTRRGVLRVRLYCRSRKPCQGLLKLRTTGRPKRGVPGNLRLGKRTFKVPAGQSRLVAVKLSKYHRRAVVKQGTTTVRAFARVRFGGGKARRVRATFRLVAPKRAGRRAR